MKCSVMSCVRVFFAVPILWDSDCPIFSHSVEGTFFPLYYFSVVTYVTFNVSEGCGPENGASWLAVLKWWRLDWALPPVWPEKSIGWVRVSDIFFERSGTRFHKFPWELTLKRFGKIFLKFNLLCCPFLALNFCSTQPTISSPDLKTQRALNSLKPF